MSAAPRPFSRPPEGPVQYVQPGQMVLSAEPRTLSTILGSCVAVCLWDRQTGAGGMNHYLLPSRPGNATPSHRFGDVAVPDLVGGLLALGVRRERVDAKVFGGARVLDAGEGADHLGIRNAEIAVELLRQEGIPVIGGDVGGRRGRRVLFDLQTGQAWVRLL
jgi:chemotaxis protein CheD